jgi:hypothetical protein
MTGRDNPASGYPWPSMCPPLQTTSVRSQRSTQRPNGHQATGRAAQPTRRAMSRSITDSRAPASQRLDAQVPYGDPAFGRFQRWSRTARTRPDTLGPPRLDAGQSPILLRLPRVTATSCANTFATATMIRRAGPVTDQMH